MIGFLGFLPFFRTLKTAQARLSASQLTMSLTLKPSKLLISLLIFTSHKSLAFICSFDLLDLIELSDLSNLS